MSYVIFGRAIKNEYISLGVLTATFGAVYASLGGKKEQHAAPAKASVEERINYAKEAVPLGAGSSEEERLIDSIKRYIEEEEKKIGKH